MPSDIGIPLMEEEMERPPHPWIARRPAPEPCDLDRLRAHIRGLAALITEACPPSAERADALAHLDAVAFHVVGGFARRFTSAG